MLLVAYLSIIGLLLIITLKLCLGVLLPFIIGAILAVIVQKPALYVSQRVKLKQGTVALFMVVGIYIILLFMFVFFGSRLYGELVKLYEKLPDYTESFSVFMNDTVEKIENLFKRFGFENSSALGNVAGQSLTSLGGKAIEMISDFIAALIRKAPSFIFGLLVTVISGCFIAKDFCVFKKILHFALNEKRIEFFVKIKNILYENVFKLLKGYLILSLIAFAVLTVGFLIIGVKNAVKVAFITAVIDLLPVFGSGAVLIPWALVSILKGDTWLFVGLLVLYAAVVVIRNVLEPKIVGKQVGLHPLITLLALFLGVKFFGVMGIFVVPLIVTVVYKYTEERVTEKENEHSI